MLIGAYGRFWDRDRVDFGARGWRLLGRRGLYAGTIKVVDFRKARGVYVLYDDVGVYYVGLASSSRGIGGRLKDHLHDEHGSAWTRFSWFTFDDPAEDRYPDGVYKVNTWDAVDLESKVLIRELEALLQIAMVPFANRNNTQFSEADEWMQVATIAPAVETFDELRHRL